MNRPPTITQTNDEGARYVPPRPRRQPQLRIEPETSDEGAQYVAPRPSRRPQLRIEPVPLPRAAMRTAAPARALPPTSTTAHTSRMPTLTERANNLTPAQLWQFSRATPYPMSTIPTSAAPGTHDARTAPAPMGTPSGYVLPSLPLHDLIGLAEAQVATRIAGDDDNATLSASEGDEQEEETVERELEREDETDGGSTSSATTTTSDVVGFADAKLRSAIDSLKASLDGLEQAVQNLSEEVDRFAG
ncbi:hypothetical protein DICSQDRAFT_170185 [Dichomitus squalens LYAD-421 SS1]|uniref:Uncharacterized protein n=1 Tax=Dichomitus squalens (strain LYAD-421) TaxID=732165 RepID=R7SZN9_DICSQ|nr:uncharacterized protein DICSQDRAFT_170185 [Dichomitus squalens LYAD-421 SS1]EJF61433.1 hypothetical protein DICSQDRAFT_170185 [Dichomitus squalens LYAD-421 SS1]